MGESVSGGTVGAGSGAISVNAAPDVSGGVGAADCLIVTSPSLTGPSLSRPRILVGRVVRDDGVGETGEVARAAISRGAVGAGAESGAFWVSAVPDAGVCREGYSPECAGEERGR